METELKERSLKVDKLIKKNCWTTSEKHLFGRSGLTTISHPIISRKKDDEFYSRLNKQGLRIRCSQLDYGSIQNCLQKVICLASRIYSSGSMPAGDFMLPMVTA